MIDPHTKTRFHSDLRLETWYPEGVLDIGLATVMIHYLGFEESISDGPFNRFADLTRLTAIHLAFVEISRIAAERRESYDGGPPVKSAFLATSAAAYGVAQMFATLMESSPIEVRVFRSVESAAGWLEVPLAALLPEP